MSVTTTEAIVEIDDLRNRLERRNHLLDIVRKAYHRDIFVVRDCLMRMKNGEPLETVLISTNNLASVSSIDLRDDPGFFLFSPHECEMKLKPCYYCGGRFEVVHNESSLIKLLRADLGLSQAKVCQLEDVMNQQLSTINKLRDTENNLSFRLQETLFHLQYERYRYKQLLCECVNYKRDSHRATQSIADYERVKLTLDKCSRELATSEERENLLTHELTHQRLISEKLQNDYQLEKKHKQESKNRCISLESELTSSNIEKATLEDRLSRAENDLDSLKRRQAEQTLDIRSLEDDKTELRNTIERMVRENENIIKVASETEDLLKTQIVGLRRELVESSIASESRFEKYEEMFNKYKEERVRELQLLEGKVEHLKNLSTSFITLLYDRSLLFYNILVEYGVHSNKQRERIDNAYVYINDCLNRSLESDRLDWSNLLSDDDDRRHIFGNLSNRLVSDSNALINLISTLNDRGIVERDSLRRDYENKMKRYLETHHEKLKVLELMNEEKEHELSIQNSVCAMALCDAQSTRREWEKVEDELISSSKTAENLKIRLADYLSIIDRLQKELEKEKEQNQNLQQLVYHLEKNASAYETSIDNLEKLLGRTSNRFASIMAKEKERLETNVSQGIQVTPTNMDFGQQVDFILQLVYTQDNALVGSQRHMKVYRANLQT